MSAAPSPQPAPGQLPMKARDAYEMLGMLPTAPAPPFDAEEAKALVRQFFAAIDGDFTDPNSTTKPTNTKPE